MTKVVIDWESRYLKKPSDREGQLNIYFKGKDMTGLCRHPFPSPPAKGEHMVVIMEEMIDCPKCRKDRDDYNAHISAGRMTLAGVQDGDCGYWCNHCQGTGRTHKPWREAMVDAGFEAEYDAMERRRATEKVEKLKKSLSFEGFNLEYTLTKCEVTKRTRTEKLLDEL